MDGYISKLQKCMNIIHRCVFLSFSHCIVPCMQINLHGCPSSSGLLYSSSALMDCKCVVVGI